MTQLPEYVRQQSEQKARDRHHAIDMAIETLEDAKATFKLDIDAINRHYNSFEGSPVSTQRKSVSKNNISTDPTVAQYA